VSSALEITATPASVDTNSVSTVDITVLHNGSPVASDAVALSLSGTSGCTASNLTQDGNPITNSTVTTGSYESFTGTTEVTYSATGIAGTCTITATEADYDQSNSVTITQTAVPAANSVGSISVSVTQGTTTTTVTPDAAGVVSIPETTSSTPTTTYYTLNSTIKPPTGATLDGQTAYWSFTSIPASPDACGQSGTVPETIFGGTPYPASEKYVPTTNSGFCQVTLTTSNGGSSTIYLDQTRTSPTTPHYTVTLAEPGSTSTTSANVVSNGTATQGLEATVTDGGGAFVNNDPVLIVSETGTTTGTPFNVCGAVSPSEGSTNSNGQVSSTYTASSVFGTETATTDDASECELYAVDAISGGVSTAFTVTQIPYILNISVSPASTTVPVDSPSSITLTVTVTGSNGTPVDGDTVTAETSSPAPYNFCGTLNTSATTNTSGQAVFTYTAYAKTGFCKIKFTESETSASTTATIDQTSS
jgi:hypothetical protein